MSERPLAWPMLVLCGVGPGSGNSKLAAWFPARGRLEPAAPRDETAAQRRYRGLAWGVGDPRAAFLDSPTWAVVRVDAADGSVVLSPAVVEFSDGTVIYSGERRGAIETLIQHGADRAAMAVRLELPDLGGVADVGPFGVAVAGDSGLARGSAWSDVSVPGGYNGLAVAGRGGRATVGGYNGIAIVDAEGHATASGLAVARGPGAWLEACEPGVAVALAPAVGLEVERGGIAVALGRVRRLRLGRQAVAVVRDATGSQIRITAGDGALIVVRHLDAGDRPRYSVVRVAADTPTLDVQYIWADGTFHPTADYTGPTDEAGTAPTAPEGGPPPDMAPPGPILLSDSNDIVICMDDGWAVSEGGGAATAGPGGLAWSQEAAYARDGGVAITGGGKAHAGERGIAVCDAKRYGTAEAGNGGVAVGLGSRFGAIGAGDAGAAIYGGMFGIVAAGDDGVAIGGFESKVRVGANGIAVASCKCPLGGPGSLLVCRDLDGNVQWAVVAHDGTIPVEFLAWARRLERQPEDPT